MIGLEPTTFRMASRRPFATVRRMFAQGLDLQGFSSIERTRPNPSEPPNLAILGKRTDASAYGLDLRSTLRALRSRGRSRYPT
jgi:hypothetical protein